MPRDKINITVRISILEISDRIRGFISRLPQQVIEVSEDLLPLLVKQIAVRASRALVHYVRLLIKVE